MAHEFVGALRAKDWQVLEAEGNPLEQAVPFALLKKLVQRALQMGNIASASQSELPEGVALAHSDLWPAALCSVLDQPVNDPRWNDLEPLLRRRAIIDAVRHTIEQVISGAADDIAAGGSSLDRRTKRNRDRGLDVARGGPPAAGTADMADGGYAGMASRGWMCAEYGFGPSISLRRMRCLTVCFGRRRNSMPSRPMCSGTPARSRCFIEEVARQLVNRGILEGDAGRFATKAPWDALEIPPTVQGVIASRIDRLPKEDKALLQLASVVGPRVSTRLLAAVTGMPAAQLQSRIWSLEILDFLVESRWLASPEYEFAHDLIREVAYDFDPSFATRAVASPDIDGPGSRLRRT